MVLENTGMVETSVMQTETPESNNNQEWFDEFIESYDYSQPKKGHIFEGQIVRIDEDAVVVDIGLKRDGIVPGRDLGMLDPEMRDNLEVGDQVIVAVLATPVGDQELLVSLHKGLEHLDWQKAEALLEDETIVELEVVAHNKGGLLVRYGALRGFAPASQVPELRRLRDSQRLYRAKQAMVGEQIALKAIEVDRQRRRLVFSGLAAQSELRKKSLQQLEKDQIVMQAKIVSVVDFGVFVDLGDIDGLVHISELDWKKLRHPSQQFRVGDEIDVKILEIDVENERVSLSRKALLPNPLEALLEKYKPGQVVSGEITNILDFGAFVRLEPQVVGLIHTSELGYSASGKPQDLVKIREKVLVRVLDVSPQRGRISLSMRRVPRDEQIAWMEAELEREAAAAAVSETETVEEVQEIPEAQIEGEVEDTSPVGIEAEVQEQVEASGSDTPEGELEMEAELISSDIPEAELEEEVEESLPDAPDDELETVTESTSSDSAETEVQAEDDMVDMPETAEAELEGEIASSPDAVAEDQPGEQDEGTTSEEPEAVLETETEESESAAPESELESEPEAGLEGDEVVSESSTPEDGPESELDEPEPDDQGEREE